MLKKTASKIVQEKAAKAGNLISNKFIDKIKKLYKVLQKLILLQILLILLQKM